LSDELTFYILGVFTPFIGLTTVYILKWLLENKLKLPFLSKENKREGCPECGSTGRHHKECSRNKEAKK